MSKRRGCGGCLFRVALAGFVVLLLVGAGLAYLLWQPYKGFADSVVVEIPRGTSTSAIGDQLARSGVIRYPWEFMILRGLRPTSKLQAGEYQFTVPASAWTVYSQISRGQIFFYELTIPEGHNIFEIARDVDTLKFIKGADFLRIARNP